MRKILFAFLALIIIPLTISSQPPGYLGKRASVLFNLASFPAFLGPTQNNRGILDAGWRFQDSKQGLAFNYEFNLEFSYVVGRMRSLSFQVGQYYTGAVTETSTIPRSSTSNPFPDIFSRKDRHSMFNRLNVRSIGLMYYKFNPTKGALAPVGNNWGLGLKYLFVNSEIVDKRTVYAASDGPLVGHQPLGLANKTSFLFLKFSFSNTQIIKDRIIIRTGFQLGFPIHKFIRNLSDDTEALYIMRPEDEQYFDYKFPVFRRLFYHELLRFDIGVGYLL